MALWVSAATSPAMRMNASCSCFTANTMDDSTSSCTPHDTTAHASQVRRPHTHAHTCTHMHAHTHYHTRTHTHTNTHMHTHARTHTRTYTHTHAHTDSPSARALSAQERESIITGTHIAVRDSVLLPRVPPANGIQQQLGGDADAQGGCSQRLLPRETGQVDSRNTRLLIDGRYETARPMVGRRRCGSWFAYRHVYHGAVGT